MLIKYLFLGCCIFYESGKQREPENSKNQWLFRHLHTTQLSSGKQSKLDGMLLFSMTRFLLQFDSY